MPRDHDLALPVRRWIAHRERLRDQLGAPDPADLDALRRTARQISDRLVAIYTAPAPEGTVTVDDIAITRDDKTQLRVRRYRPTDADGTLPTQVFAHGGGFTTGTVEELVNERLLAARCATTGVQVLSVEYRLSPEHLYPAAVDDAITAFDAAVHDQRLSADPDRIGIAGNSAGATIAASATLKIRDTRQTRLVHQLLEAPQVTFEPFGESMIKFDLDRGPLAPPAQADLRSPLDVGKFYLGDDPDKYAVPLDADVHDLPPTLIMTAEFDPLRDQGEAYAAKLRSADVPVTLIRNSSHMHGTPALTAVWEGSREWQARVNRAMIDVYGDS